MIIRRIVAGGIGLVVCCLLLLSSNNNFAHTSAKPAEAIQPVDSSQSSQSLQAAETAPFGFETNVGRINNTSIRQRAEELGASWIRLNTVSWRDLQTTESMTNVADWDWDTLNTFEQEILTANELGLTPLVIADDFPDWAVKPYYDTATGQNRLAPCAALKTAYFDDYALFLREMVSRYKDPPYNVRYWELGNEVDVDPRLMTSDLQNLFGCWGQIEDSYYGGEHYGEMLKVVAPVMRGVDPNAQIVIGGLLLDRAETNIQGRGNPEKFLRGILEAGAGDSFDIVAFHSYPWYSWENGRKDDVDLSDYRWTSWGGMTIGKARFLRAIMKDYDVDKPLFLDEAALLFWGGSATPDFLQTQADHIVRVQVRAISEGVKMFSWYTLHKSGWNSSGLLNSDASVRPAFTAYQNLIRMVGDSASTVTTADYGSAIEAYRFAHEKGYLDILWSRDGNNHSIQMAKPALIEAIDRDGNGIEATMTETRVFLSAGIAPIYIVHTLPPDTIPVVTEVEENVLYNTEPTSIKVTGEHFDSQVTVWLELNGSAGNQNIQLENVSVVSSNELQAEIPAMLPPGKYDVVVQNTEGWFGLLAKGIEIKALYPEVASVLPVQGRTDRENIVHIHGKNFYANTAIYFGETRIHTDSITFLNDHHMRLAVPADTLDAGVYDVKVVNTDTTNHTLKQAVAMIAQGDVDLYGYENHLWTDPVLPREEEPTRIGFAVQFPKDVVISDTISLTFYDGTEESDEYVIGKVDASATVTQTSYVMWTDQVSGEHTLCVRIDSGDAIREVFETNNKVCRDVMVLPRYVDGQKPRIERFTINGESHATTTNPTVNLVLSATDVVSDQEAVSDTLQMTNGIMGVLLQEFEYNPGNEEWIPVHVTDWMSASTVLDQSFAWELLPIAGKKYVHAWVVDDFGNVAGPAVASVDYISGDDEGVTLVDEPYWYTMPLADFPVSWLPGYYEVSRVYLPLVLQ